MAILVLQNRIRRAVVYPKGIVAPFGTYIDGITEVSAPGEMLMDDYSLTVSFHASSSFASHAR